MVHMFYHKPKQNRTKKQKCSTQPLLQRPFTWWGVERTEASGLEAWGGYCYILSPTPVLLPAPHSPNHARSVVSHIYHAPGLSCAITCTRSAPLPPPAPCLTPLKLQDPAQSLPWPREVGAKPFPPLISLRPAEVKPYDRGGNPGSERSAASPDHTAKLQHSRNKKPKLAILKFISSSSHRI